MGFIQSAKNVITSVGMMHEKKEIMEFAKSCCKNKKIGVPFVIKSFMKLDA